MSHPDPILSPVLYLEDVQPHLSIHSVVLASLQFAFERAFTGVSIHFLLEVVTILVDILERVDLCFVGDVEHLDNSADAELCFNVGFVLVDDKVVERLDVGARLLLGDGDFPRAAMDVAGYQMEESCRIFTQT